MINYCDYKERGKRSAKTFFKKKQREKTIHLEKRKKKRYFFPVKQIIRKQVQKRKF